MQFDKPKVTIDLEEYKYLKDRVNGIDNDEYVVAAKKVIAALLMHRSDMHKAYDTLYKEGIIFSVAINSTSTHWSEGISPDQISIALIDKTK